MVPKNNKFIVLFNQNNVLQLINLSYHDFVVKQIKNSFVNIFTSCAVDALVGCQKISVTNEENSYTREKNKEAKEGRRFFT